MRSLQMLWVTRHKSHDLIRRGTFAIGHAGVYCPYRIPVFYLFLMDTQGHRKEIANPKQGGIRVQEDSFVLEKSIFANIFEKDIRRIYIYKKAERLAKAIHLVSPAFRNSPALRDRMDTIAVALVDAAILPPGSARDQMSRELLALSSVLSIARTGLLLSPMNADFIAKEAHQLLQEVAAYEEPRLFLDDSPSLAALAKEASRESSREPMPQGVSQAEVPRSTRTHSPTASKPKFKGQTQGHFKDKNSTRRDAIKGILASKGPSYIKDISLMIRDVSEKTIQRDLQSLIDGGEVVKTGERRWTVYSVA